MKIKLSEFDAVKYLTDQEAIEAYLDSAFETGDSNHITNAIGNVIRAQGMMKMAKKANLDRSNLYNSFLKVGGDPRISTIFKVMDALGYRLSYQLKTERHSI